jgi:hypothetical protein
VDSDDSEAYSSQTDRFRHISINPIFLEKYGAHTTTHSLKLTYEKCLLSITKRSCTSYFDISFPCACMENLKLH